ncbi:MAG: hypothetical protein ACR2OG_09915 [Gemmatimonadaceae bacterium]
MPLVAASRLSRPSAVLSLLITGLLTASRLGAQGPPAPSYPLAPSPVLDMRSFPATPALSGYLSERTTRRNDSTGFLLNRARITVQAGPRSFLGIKLQGDFSGAQTGRLRSDSTVSGFTLTDAYVELVPPPDAAPAGSLLALLRPALVVGQFKMPFSLEYVTPFGLLKTANRSQVVDRITPKRDIGAMSQISFSRYATLAAAAVNGEGANATANPDAHQLVLSRLVITPTRCLEVAGKIANESADHVWGYDTRLLWRGLTLEGESIYRKRPVSATTALDAGGGYALIGYRILPWLEPVYKYDRYWDTRTTVRGTTTTIASSSSTWNVFGVNLSSAQQSIRLQLDWQRRSERPTPGRTDEYIAQVIANF